MTNRLVDPLLLAQPVALERPERASRHRARGRSMRVVVVATCLALAMVLGLAGAPRASAGDVTCTGLMAAATVHGNVVVPPGQECIILGSTIYGNVIVKPTAGLVFRGSTAYGNIEADGFRRLEIDQSIVVPLPTVFSRLTGNVVAKNGSNAGPGLLVRILQSSIDGNTHLELNDGRVDIAGNTLGGDVKVEKSKNRIDIGSNSLSNLQFYENQTTQYEISGNVQVRGNVQVYKNSHAGSGRIFNNGGQSVQCFDNAPPPTQGGPNPAAGKAEGQCFK